VQPAGAPLRTSVPSVLTSETYFVVEERRNLSGDAASAVSVAG
jgi:hypothetical protein